MNNFALWLKIAAGFQMLTCIIHGLTFFFQPPANNDTERQIFDLMRSYRFDFGAGFHRSMGDLTTGLSICFCLVCLLGALVNWYLLRSGVASDVMSGIININLVVFGACFVAMSVFTFLPPIVLTGLIVVFLAAARIVIPNSASL